MIQRMSLLFTQFEALGPYFTVNTHEADELPQGEWRSMADLGRGEALGTRIEAVRVSLSQRAGRDVEPRVVASVAQLGLVARLIAPALAADALGLSPVSLSLENLWWQDKLGGPYPLSVTIAPNGVAPDDAVSIISGAIIEQYAVSPQVVWGNVGSAANSAANLIAAARPDVREAALAAADRVLADPRVDGGELRAGPLFRRRSCCLIYQLTDNRAAVCGDCVLN